MTKDNNGKEITYQQTVDNNPPIIAILESKKYGTILARNLDELKLIEGYLKLMKKEMKEALQTKQKESNL